MTAGSPRDSKGGTRRLWPGAALGLLLLGLLAVDAVAVWGIVSARRSAHEAARVDLELQTEVHARSLEALLANLRADLVFLSQSPPVAELPTLAGREDPMVRRWLRLNAESTLLLFLAANPAVRRLEVCSQDGSALLAAGRVADSPQILPPRAPLAGPEALLRGSWTLPGASQARLQAWIAPAVLLEIAAPGLEQRVRLERAEPARGPADGDTLWVATTVTDDQWEPPVRWWLTRREAGGQVVRSFEELSRRYRRTLIANIAVIILSLVLATVAYRQMRHAARLEAENRQQSRIRELERQLAHSERLASVGRLAAGMAHEINNPLEGMANFLAVLEDDLKAGDLESAARWTPKLRHGLDRSAGVIRQVLAFSEPGTAAHGPVDLLAVLRETVDFVAANPAFSGLEISLFDPPEAIEVVADPTALGQVFLNLLLNACEAEIEGAGEAGEVEVRVETSARAVIVRVGDRGAGFAPEALTHAFEPFYSGRGSSGLGLAVCHGIVQNLGGSIELANRAGGGAEVRVELPRTPRREAERVS